MTITTERRPIPEPRNAWVDADGRPNPVVFQYFRDLDRLNRDLVALVNELEARVEALEAP